MAENPTRPLSNEQQLAEVARLSAEGLTRQEIAARLGVLPYEVLMLEREIVAQVRQTRAQMAEQALVKQLDKLDRLEAALWRAFEDSRKPTRKRRVSRTLKDASGDLEELLNARTDEKGTVYIDYEEIENAGDPRFLAGIQWVIEQYGKLFGTYAPTRHEVEGATTRYELKWTVGKPKEENDDGIKVIEGGN